MKKLFVAMIAATLVLTGCNTIKGFGKDVSKAGETMSEKAEEKM